MDFSRFALYFEDAVIYLVAFAATAALSVLYEQSRIKSGNRASYNTILRFALLAIAALPVGLLIGMRSVDVGFDTASYFNHFQRVIDAPLLQSITVYVGNIDPLFVALMFLSGKIGLGNFSFFLFVVAQMTIMLFIAGFEKWRNDISVPLAIFMMLLYFGPILTDQMRQLLALSIIVFVSRDIVSGDRLGKAFAGVVMAALIHSSALVCLAALAVSIKYRSGGLKHPIVWSLTISLAGLAPEYILHALSLVLNSTSYANYFFQETITATKQSVNSGLGFLMTLIPLAVPFILFYRKRGMDCKGFLLLIASASIPFRMLGYVSNFVVRLVYYPAIASIIFASSSLLIKKGEDQKNSLDVVAVFISVGIMLAYFFLNFVIVGAHGSFPYFSVLG